jgi:hypothetical protein
VIITLTKKGTELRQKAKTIPDDLGCGLGLRVASYDTLLGDISELRNHIREYRQKGANNPFGCGAIKLVTSAASPIEGACGSSEDREI